MSYYVSSTQKQKEEMLSFLGQTNAIDLFEDVPKEVLLGGLNMQNGMSEMELCSKIDELAAKNTVFKTVFRGAGAYRHFIPAVVQRMAAKEEFVTAYTPYQAEISQGILQSIFEYQTMICALTNTDVANASIYDGATAAAEGVAMCKERKRDGVIIFDNCHPHTVDTVKTYCHANGLKCTVLSAKNGCASAQDLSEALSDAHCAVYMQQPNYYGIIEDVQAVADATHASGAKLVVGVNPLVLASLKTPAACGADITVGEGQPLGMPLSFGGPYLGFMATSNSLMRRLPGRIVGQTTDGDGNRCFVLTLQAREQHIRREKASSNVCSNQALCALTAAAYMGTMGPVGMAQAAELCYNKAHYLAQKLCEGNKFKLVHGAEFFNEFVTTCPCDVNLLMQKLEEHSILGGLPLKDGNILWCATELNTRQDIDTLVKIATEVAAG